LEEVRPSRTPAADRGRHIVRGLGSLTVQSVLNAVLGFILLATLVRYLPQTDYGTYASVQVSVGIAGVVSGFGLGSAVVYFLASDSGEAGGSWGAAKAALYVTLTLSGAVSLVMAAAAPYLSSYFAKDASLTWAFYLGALWLFISSVATPLQTMLQGMRRYGSLASVLLGARVVSVTVAVAGVAIYHSLTAAIASQILFFALVLASTLPLVLGPLRRADPKPHYGRAMRYAYPLGLASVVGAVAGNADIVVVGGYLNLGSLGVYNAAIQISSVLSAFFVNPLITALFAEASFSSESEQELKIGTSLAIRFSLVTLLPASLLAAAMSPQLFDLFSGGRASYLQGIPYLQLITLFYVFAAVQTVAISILQGVGRTRQVLIVGTIAALGEVGLSASLVPSLALAGAAYSRVAIFVVGCGLSLYYIRQYLPRGGGFGFLARALLASAIPAAVMYLLSVSISSRVITLLPYTMLALALFAASARVLKLLSTEDKAYLEHLLPASLTWVLKLL
jgi:O-antigen/teichoic acid export membrane protein